MEREGLFDIHCHIIPEVDDGASNHEEMQKLLQMEYEQGVRNIIVTPHFRTQMFETPLEQVRKQFACVQRALQESGYDINIYLGCEFYANMDMIEMLKAGKISTMAGSDYVLVEFSGSADASYIKERIYSLHANEYKPVIAHIERCDKLRKDMEFVAELVEMGAYMQVNANSIIGKNGFGMKQYCKKLMKYDLIHFIGSDCHNSDKRIPRIGEAYHYVSKKMGKAYADQIFIENPKKIIDNRF